MQLALDGIDHLGLRDTPPNAVVLVDVTLPSIDDLAATIIRSIPDRATIVNVI